MYVQVVDAVGSDRKQVYEGKEYDYVFDVDIKDGAPPLKLPYNVTRMYTEKHMHTRKHTCIRIYTCVNVYE